MRVGLCKDIKIEDIKSGDVITLEYSHTPVGSINVNRTSHFLIVEDNESLRLLSLKKNRLTSFIGETISELMEVLLSSFSKYAIIHQITHSGGYKIVLDD